MDLSAKIKEITGVAVKDIEPLSGGCVGQVYRVGLVDGRLLVAKVDEGPAPQLGVEGDMLVYLAERSDLPVPEVIFCQPELLLMRFVSGRNSFSEKAQEDAAVHLAALHNISSEKYGFKVDTLIGGLDQPNSWTDSWIDFFRDQRLLYMGRQAVDKGRMPKDVLRRLEVFCGRLDAWLVEPERPSLIHGDAWSGNILADHDRITGFIDPAIYYADPEIELAFTTLFGTFGESFFKQYNAIRPISPGFFEERIDIYNLYPLLVHVCLFGGHYVSSVERTLQRFGE